MENKELKMENKELKMDVHNFQFSTFNSPLKKVFILLDSGHGGIDPSSGEYVTAGKRSPLWPDGTIYYEGVGNREIVKVVAQELDKLNIEYAFTVSPDNWHDVSLKERCKTANEIFAKNKNAVLISVHSNAADSADACGFEVFTSRLASKISTKMARTWFKEMKAEFVGHPPRGVKQKDFYILRNTNCPAVLLETMFHTNYKECKILQSAQGKQRIAKVIVETIKIMEN